MNNDKNNTILGDYKTLYENEVIKNQELCKLLHEKELIIEKLKNELVDKTIDDTVDTVAKKTNVKKTKTNGKEIAKNGLEEELLVVNDLNTNEDIKAKFKKFIGEDNLGTFQKQSGNGKTDITDQKNKIQVKKHTKDCFGQLDRHWVKDIIKIIPELKSIEKYLIDLCELPLDVSGKKVDKSKSIKKLDGINYTKEQLDVFLDTLNKNKENILKIMFYGVNEINKPNYLCGIEYVNGIRKKMTIYKMNDVIEHLMKFKFLIRKSATVVELGPCLTIQRKGGDSGKKGSNQMQFKLTFTKLNIPTKLEHDF